MANTSYYLDALLQFDSPATVREVHEKAKEMFGSAIKGDRASCRLSLDRHIISGKAEKINGKYITTKLAADPIGAMTIKIKSLEAQLEDAHREIARQRKQLEGVS